MVSARKAIIVAGVSGCGKSTIGRALAERIDWPFLEADDFHSENAKAKMAAGEPLVDADRAPWLVVLNAELLRRAPVVLACSALKQSYRDRLSESLDAAFVWIELTRELALQRVGSRRDHFMPASLVDSQFEAAEKPSDAVFVSATLTVEASVERCAKKLDGFVCNR
ncbi:MAG: gluconokinase [Pseudomonadota bacterium]